MTKDKSELLFVPLGGVGEIGMNLAMYGYGPRGKWRWIIVDIGVTFPGPELPGVDLVLPDIQFLLSQGKRVEAIVITHAHEDHYGALLALWPQIRVPVHCTPFTAGLLEAKKQSEPGAPDVPLTIYRAGETFKAGPFEIEAIHVTHSIPEPVSLTLKSPLGKIIHTGDWKIDHAPSLGQQTDEARFRALGKEGILAIICDSTNAMRDGVSPSEQSVSDSLAEIISASTGRVLVTTFSSNVGRIRSIAEAAQKAGRKVVVLGRSLLRVVDVSRELGYLDGIGHFLPEDDFDSIPRNELVVILTGSQGEPRAALAKLATGSHRNASLTPGDKVIFSSRTIPGNEKSILSIKNALIDQGVEIVTDSDALVHVSGHPRRNELQSMYEWVKPTIAVPVHGEAAHLVCHAGLAAEFGVPDVAPVRNGDMLRLAPGPSEIIGQAASGRIYKDGRLIGDDNDLGISKRRALSFAGHITLSVVIDKSGDIIADPDMECLGIPLVDGKGDDLEDRLYDAALGAFKSIPKNGRKDVQKIEDALSRAIRSECRAIWGKKPITTVFVTRV